MTGTMLSAMILSDIITDKKKDFAEIFSPSRSILKPQLLINGFEAIKNLMTFSKKRCTHMGCALKWTVSSIHGIAPVTVHAFPKKEKFLTIRQIKIWSSLKAAPFIIRIFC